MDMPPLGVLRTFEVAARRGSFLLAALELNVTPGAVSKQIKSLEQFLGLALFERHHRRVELTAAGAAYGTSMSRIMADLRTATDAIVAPSRGENLVLWCAPWFLKAWLLPRLDEFRRRFPGVRLDLLTGESSEAVSPHAQIAIRLGHGQWPKTRADPLMPQEIIAVCTSEYLARSELRPPFAFEKFVVLDSANTPHHFVQWAQAAGLGARAPRERIIFQSNETAFAAAQQSYGLALTNRFFAVDELAIGRLVAPWDAAIRTEKTYFVTYSEQFPLSKHARMFRSWLLTQCARIRSTG